MTILKNLALLIFIGAVWALASCSSSNTDKYSLISDSDKTVIGTFCDCVTPLHSLLKRMEETTDTARKIALLDSMTKSMNGLKPCLEKAQGIEKKSRNNPEFNKQMLAYIKQYNKDCYDFVMGEEKTSNNK